MSAATVTMQQQRDDSDLGSSSAAERALRPVEPVREPGFVDAPRGAEAGIAGGHRFRPATAAAACFQVARRENRAAERPAGRKPLRPAVELGRAGGRPSARRPSAVAVAAGGRAGGRWSASGRRRSRRTRGGSAGSATASGTGASLGVQHVHGLLGHARAGNAGRRRPPRPRRLFRPIACRLTTVTARPPRAARFRGSGGAAGTRAVRAHAPARAVPAGRGQQSPFTASPSATSRILVIRTA